MEAAAEPAWPEMKAAANDRLAGPSLSQSAPVWVAAWVVFSSFCSCAGWVLSALHQLNAAGYAAAFLLGAGVVWTLRHKLFPAGIRGWNLHRAHRRFGRAFPLAFLILASLAFLGGALHPPSNADALAYRVPRVLHWLAEGQWHWIHTDSHRLNARFCGVEWLSAPLIAFTRTERFLFLINAASFLLMPGLVFSLFTRVGVRPRVAWRWMWLTPTGYCYLLQAGSVSNDMFSVVYALAAVDFALRARQSGRLSEVCLSLLSAALLTGAKTSNMPLLLPWVVAFVPTWRVWLAHPLALAVLILPVAGASFLPTAVLNTVYSGDWTAQALQGVYVARGPLWLRWFVNVTTLALNSLAPPLFPFASVWNGAVDAITPASLRMALLKDFEAGGERWKLPEIQLEEYAGLGFGLTVLLGLGMLAIFLGNRKAGKAEVAPFGEPVMRVLCIAPWLSLLYMLTNWNLTCLDRILAPYYPLLVMSLLLSPRQVELVRRAWWRRWAFVAFGLAGLLLVLSPARPLWPAGWFFQHYGARLKSSRLGSRAMNAYATKGNRAEAFAPVLALLPADASVFGFSAREFAETSLWRPLGSRHILRVKASHSGEDVRRRGIKYVLVTSEVLNEPWPDWQKRMDARTMATVTLRMWGGGQPVTWHLVELNPHDAGRGTTEPQARTEK
jgi:hypothetical protein